MPYEIDEYNAQQLKQAAGLKHWDESGNATEMPADLLRAWCEFKVCFDRIGGRTPTPDTIADIARQCGYGKLKSADIKPVAIGELWTTGQVVHDTEVVVQYRGKEVIGKLKGVSDNGKKATVQLDGEGIERQVAAETVSVAQLAVV